MSIWSTILHKLELDFGKNGDVAQRVIAESSKFVKMAQPVVALVETEIKPIADADPTSKMAAIEKFLLRYEPELAIVSTTATQLAKLPTADLLRNVALFSLQALAPGAPASMLNFAIEFAYSILKAKISPESSPK